MFTRKNVIRACFAAVVTLGLAACGGGSDTMEPPDLGPAKTAAAAAETAAETASDAAAAAVAAVADIKNSDASSHALAQLAANDAMDAYMDAKAASEKAAAAATLADAEMYQQAALAAQARAEAARDDAVMYADMVTQAQAEVDAANSAAATEAAALTMARGEADMAADAAEMAAREAAAAVDAVMGISGADADAYASAQAAAEAAMEAAKAARDASDAADRALTSADAAMHQATAEGEQLKAENALTDAKDHAGMVTQAKVDADAEMKRKEEAAAEMEAVKMAQKAAMDAVTAAKMAADNAAQAVMDIADSADLNTTTAAANARAEDARDAAAEAHLDAVAADTRAQAATTLEDAKKHQADAEEAQAAAEAAYKAVMGFTGIVAAQQKMADDAADEAQMLADARMKASEAAGAARTAADAAKTAAEKIAGLAGADSEAAKTAKTLADEAEAAAVAAETARDNAAADDTMSADAIAEQMTAMEEQGTAEARLATLTRMQNDAQVAHDTTAEQLEARDLADAKAATQKAADEVNSHYMAAKSKAEDARKQANIARAAARMATGSRTDYENADKYAKMAEAEAANAEAAAARAMQANADAMAANVAAMTAETSDEAEAQQDIAEAANVIATEAHTGDTGAGMAYMAARDAAEKAGGASEVHVLGLLQLMNGHGLTGSAQDTHLMTINEVLLQGLAGDTDNASAETTVMVTWRYHGDLGEGDIVGGTGAAADTKPGEGLLDIMVTPTGGTLADLTRDDPDTHGTDEQNFVEGPGLGVFAEYHISGAPSDEDDSNDNGRPRSRVLVFTDKEQASGPSPASNVEFTGLSPMVDRVGWDSTNSVYHYDHDGNSRTANVPVDLVCAEGVTCNVSRDADEKVVTISGYTLSSRTAAASGEKGRFPVPATDEMEDSTYLAFGVWLQQADDGTYTFGAFDDGGTVVQSGGTPAAMVGKATYNGKAAGVHNTPDATNFFHADATLMANFDVVDDSETAVAGGTITGRIHNIMSGGSSVSGDIHLGVTTGANPNNANIDGDGAFRGTAWMGTGSRHAVTNEVIYPYNGVWSGKFYNAAPATTPNAPPMSAAGTFGVTHTNMMGTMGDPTDDEVSSFIGAFGAHKAE